MSQFRISSGVYQRIYVEAYGNLPQPCVECGQEVLKFGWHDGCIHHVDEDRSNNDPDNLVLMHHSCHTTHHRRGKPRPESMSVKLRESWQNGTRTGHPHSEETRQQISQTLTGHEVTSETRSKISSTLKGRKFSDERRANLRRAWVRRKMRQQ